MKALAAEGRTMFVSSHLMSEIQNTADHLIVIGRGQLLAECTMEEFIARSSGQTVRVATPQADLLVKAVAEAGGSAVNGADGTLIVSGLVAAQVGDLAFEHGVRLHELTVVRASLEAAFMELTADSVEYRTGADGAQASPRPRDSRGGCSRNSPGTGGPAMTGGADPDQHRRADLPGPAGHRGARRAGAHGRVLHRDDPDLADRDAPADRHLPRQGGGLRPRSCWSWAASCSASGTADNRPRG